MESIWSKTTHTQQRPALTRDLEVEAAVIGGGLAGILTAFFLKQRGVEAVVLEALRVGSGQTKNTTAKITSQHGLIYDKLIKNFGEDKARQYAEANELAIREYKRVINEQSIECDFEEYPAYLYSRDPKDVSVLTEEAHAARGLGIDAGFTRETNLPFDVAGAVKFGGQAQFHPLKFLLPIAKDLTIFERTKANAVKGNRIETENGTVTAKHIVFATHFPFVNMPGFYFTRMHQERSYVISLENASRLNGMYLGIDSEGLSLRNFENMLLLGGGGHRTGENSAGGKYEFLRQKANRLYPQSKESAHWSAQDCMSVDSVPYIGRFAASTPDWYVATGFGKWGMTSAMVSAMLIADMITGKENPYSEVFSPSRFTPSASAQAFITDLGQSVKGLSRQIFSIPSKDIEELPAGHGGVVEYDGEKAGVYKDENEKVYIVSTRCPHLGCRLEWNPDEKSWDCPCHGSRFDYEGNLLDNPAQINLESVKNEP